ncbi:hypothetical protein GIB67_023215, partial [Kingdonia uniflora]
MFTIISFNITTNHLRFLHIIPLSDVENFLHGNSCIYLQYKISSRILDAISSLILFSKNICVYISSILRLNILPLTFCAMNCWRHFYLTLRTWFQISISNSYNQT